MNLNLIDHFTPGQIRARTVAGLTILFLSALPDAMVVPVLRQLIVDRYDVSVGAAHYFMCVNIIGALAMAPFLSKIRRGSNALGLVTVFAFLNGLFLSLISFPIGFYPTLIVRSLEGGVDLAVYALIFHELARLGDPATKGRRMGAAATCMMIGIAGGIGFGGIVGRGNPLWSLWLGSLACFAVAIGAIALRAAFGSLSRSNEFDESIDRASAASPSPLQSIWPAYVMMFVDRALSSLLATTFPLFFASVIGLNSAHTGMLVGTAMLMTALGAWPAGRLAEKTGWRNMRLVAGVFYAGGIALVPMVVGESIAIPLLIMAIVGIAGAALFASSLLVVAEHRGSASAMGGYYASGNLGFLLGAFGAGQVLSTMGGDEPDFAVYITLFVGFAIVHAVANMSASFVMRARQRGGDESPNIRVALETVSAS